MSAWVILIVLVSIWGLGLLVILWPDRSDAGEVAHPPLAGDTAYWRMAYEQLVEQTGRDLNDGLGPDPRRARKQ